MTITNMRISINWFLIILFVVSCSLGVNAQTAEQYNKLDESIEKLEGLPFVVTSRNVVLSIRKDFQYLTNKWLSAGQKELPKEYLVTLDLDTTALLAVAAINDPSKMMASLAIVRSDLDLKVRSAKRGSNASEDQGANISVFVRTTKGGREIGGYTVVCNSHLHADNPNSQFPFNSPTSPARRILPPGIYWIRIERDGHVLAEGKAEIGDKDPEEIVFEVH